MNIVAVTDSTAEGGSRAVGPVVTLRRGDPAAPVVPMQPPP